MPTGTPNNIPSNLSKTPPWPGKKLPVSFILAFLFRNENIRSPNWHAIEVIVAIKIIFKFEISVRLKNKINIDKLVNNKEPTAPAIVFFGLIFVNLGPFKMFPAM